MLSISFPAGFLNLLPRSLHPNYSVPSPKLLRLASTTASTLSEILTLLFAPKPSLDIDYPSPTHLTCSKQISTSQNGKSDSATLNRVTYEATHRPTLLPPFRHATSSPTSHSSHRPHRATANPVVISCSSGRDAALTFRKVGRAKIAIRFGTNGNSLNCLRLKFKKLYDYVSGWCGVGAQKQIPQSGDRIRIFLPLDTLSK